MTMPYVKVNISAIKFFSTSKSDLDSALSFSYFSSFNSFDSISNWCITNCLSFDGWCLIYHWEWDLTTSHTHAHKRNLTQKISHISITPSFVEMVHLYDLYAVIWVAMSGKFRALRRKTIGSKFIMSLSFGSFAIWKLVIKF